MAGATFELDARQLLALNEKIAGMAERLSDAGRRAELLDALGEEIENQTKERFASKRAPDGEVWQPWSEKYAARIGRRYPGASLLVRRRQLEQSITHVVEGEELVVGSNMEYAAAHQYGWEDIPERPYLGLTDEHVGELGMLVEDFLEELAA